MGKLLLLTTLLLAGGVAYYFGCHKCNQKKLDLSKYRADGWFGSGAKSSKIDESIKPFKLNIPDSELQDLKNRLAKSRFTDHVEGTKFNYGFNSDYLKQVVEHWKNKYDWKKEEAKLNAYPQFKTQIEGLDIHFVRVKASEKAKKVLPLLVVHGWPGSFYEYYKSFALLTEPDENGLAFEVIAPSIPGYGYSEAPHQVGFDVPATARVFVKLMKRLGHEKFLVHGGDWGNFIVRTIAVVYPENTIGAHMLGNWDGVRELTESLCGAMKVLFAEYFPSLYFSAETRAKDYPKLFPLKNTVSYLLQETGYMHIQSTKPDTVGAALVDSPVGLAAYILEKFSTWTNPANRDKEDGGLTEKFTLDELLTNVMIYWTSGNIAASQRFYKENVAAQNEIAQQKVPVPSATVDTPHEMVRSPRKLIEHNYDNLVQYSDFPRGGHFTAFEEPELVSADIRSFVSKLIQQQKDAERAAAKAKQEKEAKNKKEEI